MYQKNYIFLYALMQIKLEIKFCHVYEENCEIFKIFETESNQITKNI